MNDTDFILGEDQYWIKGARRFHKKCGSEVYESLSVESGMICDDGRKDGYYVRLCTDSTCLNSFYDIGLLEELVK